jgi:hypothetical protein
MLRVLLKHLGCRLASQRIQSLGFGDWLAIKDAARLLLLQVENGEVCWRLTQAGSVEEWLNHETPLIVESESLLTVVVLGVVDLITDKSLALCNYLRFYSQQI